MSEQWLVNDAIQTYHQWRLISQRLIQENNQQRKNQLLYEERCLERHMEYVNALYLVYKNELHRK